MKKCLIVKNHKLLWFKWTDKYYDHDWVYFGTKLRKCNKCSAKERYFGTFGAEIRTEDWRPTKFTWKEVEGYQQ